MGIKIVERAGERLVDMLHKSNPWDESDCGRKDCLPCESAAKDDDIVRKNCTQRSVIYKTWCEICKKKKKERLKTEGATKDGDGKNKRKIFERSQEEDPNKEEYDYIGETSRSSFERGREHMKDLEYFRSRSHMLKHALVMHPEITSSPS